MEQPNLNALKSKKWREANREKWNDYQREYNRKRSMADPNWRKRRAECQRESLARKIEKDPEKYKQEQNEYMQTTGKEVSKNYYQANKEKCKERTKVNYYLNKLYKTRNDYDEDAEEEWLLNTLRYCGNDNIIDIVAEKYINYIEKREAKKNLKAEILSEDTI